MDNHKEKNKIPYTRIFGIKLGEEGLVVLYKNRNENKMSEVDYTEEQQTNGVYIFEMC